MMIQLDPTNAFPENVQGRLVDACGLIPRFAVEAFRQGHDTARTVFESMSDIYGFGKYEFDQKATVDSNGVYSYPEDPDLHPLLVLSFPDNPVKVYVYQYAMVAIVDDKETIVTRMD